MTYIITSNINGKDRSNVETNKRIVLCFFRIFTQIFSIFTIPLVKRKDACYDTDGMKIPLL